MANPQPEDTMRQVKELIAFYEGRGSNWLNAAEYVLAKASGHLPYWPQRRKKNRNE